MSVFYSNPRSSDSFSFEHTATIQDIEELTLAEKEYVSPKEVLSPAQRPEVPSSFSYPGARYSTPSVPASQALRSNSRASQTSSVSEKISVFRDEEIAPRGDGTTADRSSTAFRHTPRNETAHSLLRIHVTEGVVSPDNKNHDSQETSEAKRSLDILRPAQQLQHIAAQRAELLHQLNELQRKEQEVLNQLAQPGVAKFVQSPQARPSIATSQLLNASLFPKPTASPSRLPRRVLPPKTSRKPLYLRTMSPPSISNPNTPNPPQRKPLRNKTKATLQ